MESILPIGTKMVFFQAAAPTGWAKVTDAQLDEAAIRIVTGTGGGFGGSAAFSTAFASRTPAGTVGGMVGLGSNRARRSSVSLARTGNEPTVSQAS